MWYKLKNVIALSLLLQILLVKWIGIYPHLVEKYYSNGFYPYWSGFFRWLLGWIPFSIGDIVYAILILSILYYFIKKRDRLLSDWKTTLRDIVMVLAVAYFTFHLSWGFNYYREPISKTLSLDEEYTADQLSQTTSALIYKTNELQELLAGDSLNTIQISYPQEEIFEKTIKAYSDLSEQFPGLHYKRPSLKKSLFSTLLTYMGYGGYLNPFTHESQVNSKIPNFRFPVVCGHEVGHQLGYSAENEVNFIGYLVMSLNEDPYLQYSAYAYALSHCLRELNKRQPDQYKILYSQINRGVQKNYEELHAFWKAYENPMEPIFKSIFNTFLKANNQAAGIKSYNLMVSLIIGYHKNYPITGPKSTGL
ncbi:MAG: DUF3810 domain-containing protein [Flavobacteriaceae bacterium]